MSRGSAAFLEQTLTPFLYPCLGAQRRRQLKSPRLLRCTSTLNLPEPARFEHLNPPPDDYSLAPFVDRCILTVQSGAGGHGCVSFVREKFIAEGPPNGGDGGSGGNVYIQAMRGETSLHKIARKRLAHAGRGENGKGKAMNGARGQDVLVTVPIGTVVREIQRESVDGHGKDADAWGGLEGKRYRRGDETTNIANEDWIIFRGTMKGNDYEKPAVRPLRRIWAVPQPPAPIRLDLDAPMDKPLLLAAGAAGGLGNSHFVTRQTPRPKYATRGFKGMTMEIELELKTLADVGLVGLPNAGKSTLLRALTNSRTRIGNWVFTTLQPSVGTVVLDDNTGRPRVPAFQTDGSPRTAISIADIPGLVEDAHLDKGLGLDFLRHIERAAMLAFVVDLGAGDAVGALKALWREVGEYETLKSKEVNADSERRSNTAWFEKVIGPPQPDMGAPVSSKPWFVVATKADLDGTQENYELLKAYVDALREGHEVHPSGRTNGWRKKVVVVPVSAIRAEGVDRIPPLVVDLLR